MRVCCMCAAANPRTDDQLIVPGAFHVQPQSARMTSQMCAGTPRALAKLLRVPIKPKRCPTKQHAHAAAARPSARPAQEQASLQQEGGLGFRPKPCNLILGISTPRVQQHEAKRSARPSAQVADQARQLPQALLQPGSLP